MSKTAIRRKSAKQILDARIADAYARGMVSGYKTLEVPIPLWVAEELKQALEKQ